MYNTVQQTKQSCGEVCEKQADMRPLIDVVRELLYRIHDLENQREYMQYQIERIQNGTGLPPFAIPSRGNLEDKDLPEILKGNPGEYRSTVNKLA